jgi:hypothetical protein
MNRVEDLFLKILPGWHIRAYPRAVALALAIVGLLLILAAIMLVVVSGE